MPFNSDIAEIYSSEGAHSDNYCDYRNDASYRTEQNSQKKYILWIIILMKMCFTVTLAKADDKSCVIPFLLKPTILAN